MPDADDFDVEYFRSLIKGNAPAGETAPPAATAKKAGGPAPAKTSSAGTTKAAGAARPAAKARAGKTPRR